MRNAYLVEVWEPGVGNLARARKEAYFIQMGPEYSHQDVEKVAAKRHAGDFVIVTIIGRRYMVKEEWSIRETATPL